MNVLVNSLPDYSETMMAVQPEQTDSTATRPANYLRNLNRARQALRTKDPVLGRLIDAKPDFDHHAWRATVPVDDIFEALLYQIAGQQISVIAANAIYARLRALHYTSRPNPAALAGVSTEQLRVIGLSGRKAEYVKALSQRAAAGELDGIADLPHEEARERLVMFRGIGPWTADGALFIVFGGDDVLVSGDLVLRKAIQRLYDLPELPSEKEAEAIGERWRPYRSVAAGYLFEFMIEPERAEGLSLEETTLLAQLQPL